MAPPHGRMNCSGFVTNKTCWFTCEDGYNIQGSEKRNCLNSSKWDGQQASCIGNRRYHCIVLQVNCQKETIISMVSMVKEKWLKKHKK